MPSQLLRTLVDLDPGDNPRLDLNLDKGSAIAFLLPNCLVEKDRPAYALTQSWSGHNHFAISPPSFLCLGNPQAGKSLVAGWSALVHREQAFVVCEKRSEEHTSELQS